MNNRIDAIYARQSVDKKDSISIESQIEFCKYELKGGNCKEYTDKGYSGKNTDRPKFQELVRDIKRGLIAKVVVYKLDRISRSILDFANMMELFQQYNVEFAWAHPVQPILCLHHRHSPVSVAGVTVIAFPFSFTILILSWINFPDIRGRTPSWIRMMSSSFSEISSAAQSP